MPATEQNIAVNRKAGFQYAVSDKAEAGIQLTGTEIKSVRQKQVNLQDAYCLFLHGELWVRGLHISEYREGTHYNHEPKRDRKLLLKKPELKKLQSKVKEKGVTIIPMRMYVNERGFAKLEIAVARGKKLFDKREDIKKRDVERELKQAEKNFRKREL